MDPWSQPLYFVGPIGLLLVGLLLLVAAVKRGLPLRLSAWLSRTRTTRTVTLGRWLLWVLRGWSATFVLDHLIVGDGRRLGQWIGASTLDSGSPFDYFTGSTAAITLVVVVALSIVLGRYERRLGDWRILVVPLNVVLLLWVPLAWQLSLI